MLSKMSSSVTLVAVGEIKIQLPHRVTQTQSCQTPHSLLDGGIYEFFEGKMDVNLYIFCQSHICL